MRLHIGSGSVRQGEGQTKKQRDRILVLRSIAGYLVAPGLAANIFIWSGYGFFQSYGDDHFLSLKFALAFAFSLWAYIIIPMFSLPYHIYFVKYGKATLGNYILLWTSIGIAIAVIWIVESYDDCFRNFSCSNLTVNTTFIAALKFVLVGCLGGVVFWFIACWRHDFNASDRTP